MRARRTPAHRLLEANPGTNRGSALLAAVIVAAGWAAPATAQSIWLDPREGLWQDPLRWSDGVPGTGFVAVFGGGPSPNPFGVVSIAPITIGRLEVVSQSPILRLDTDATEDLVVANEVVVAGPDDPVLTIDGHTIRVNGAQTVGTAAGPGSVVVTGRPDAPGRWIASGSLRVGDGGEGTMIVEDGAVLVLGAGATVGRNGGTGMLRIDGGSLQPALPGPPPVLSVGVGPSGHGSLVVESGVVTGPIDLGVGSFAGVPSAALHVSTSASLGPLRIGVGGGTGGTTFVDAVLDGEGSVLAAPSITVALGSFTDASLLVGSGVSVSTSSFQIAPNGVASVRIEGDVVAQNTVVRSGTHPQGGAAVEISGTGASLASFTFELGPGAPTTVLVEHGGLLSASTVRSVGPVGGSLVVGLGGTAIATSLDLESGSLELRPGSTLAAGGLSTAPTATLRWVLDRRSTGAAAPGTVAGASIGGPIEIELASGFSPAPGDVFPLLAATSDAIVNDAPRITTPSIDGIPMLLETAGGALRARVVGAIDELVAPARIVVDDRLPFDVALQAIVDGVPYDVSRQATWHFDVPGVLVEVAPGRFVATSGGATTGTATFGPASATVRFLVEAPPAPQFQLVSGSIDGAFGDATSVVSGVSGIVSLRPGSISPDGRSIVFSSRAANLVPGDAPDSPDVFRKDLIVGSVERITVGPSGASSGLAGTTTPDGRWISFSSTAIFSNDVPWSNGTFKHVYLVDRTTDSIECVSLSERGASGAQEGSFDPFLSDDGRFVGFTSNRQLTADDNEALYDAYLRDRLSGTLRCISKNPDGSPITNPVLLLSLSADGKHAVFLNKVLGSTVPWLYDWDTDTSTMVLPGLVQPLPSVTVTSARLSKDARHLALLSSGSGVLVEGPQSTLQQAYRRDLLLGTTEPVSFRAGDPSKGDSGAWADAPVESLAIDASGRFAAFTTAATNLAPGGVPGRARLFRKDMLTGRIDVVGVVDAAGGTIDLDAAVEPSIAISADGSRLAFATKATNLVPGAPPGIVQIYTTTLPVPPAGDLDGDFVVDARDVALLLGDWGGARYDLDGDGVVAAGDLAVVVAGWT
jgi:T5SS/PEP-CTERM-associated repeat protein